MEYKGPPSNGAMQGYRLLVVAMAAALAVRVLFWALTGRTWEDALITAAHAVNAAKGLGLTHHPGEGRVHGFTSALSVLIPLAGELVRTGAGIFFLKLSSAAASVVTILFAFLIGKELRFGRWPMVFLLSYLAFDQNQIFYGMTGMETQVAVAVLLASMYYLLKKDATKCGICLGLCMLARPDFVLWCGSALLYLLAKNMRAGLKAGIISAAVFMPWLVFTSLYYGSPVPHTIRAKSLVFSPMPEQKMGAGQFFEYLLNRLDAQTPDFLRYFSPFVEHDFMIIPFSYWYFLSVGMVFVFVALLGVYALRSRWAMYPAIAYVALFCGYRLLFLPHIYFTWYLPPFMAVVAVLAAAGLVRLGRAGAVLSVLLAVLYAVHIPFTYPLEAKVQSEVEDGVRKPVALYLASVASEGDAVVSESAGYIGYYSNVKLYDYPGLTSPKSYNALKDVPKPERTIGRLIMDVRPKWAVLRPAELKRTVEEYPGFAELYPLSRHFKEAPSLTRWGFELRSPDREFYVLRRADL